MSHSGKPAILPSRDLAKTAAVTYRGRFAPSPTGPLHFGSLLAAVASFLDARAHRGEWLVRIEDIDRPREVPGAADAILRTLEHFGLHWDHAVVKQSERTKLYAAAVDQLQRAGFLYECSCSRAEIQDAVDETERSADTVTEELRYPGACRDGARHPERSCALRFRVGDVAVTFEDEIQGTMNINVNEDSGDFVVRRKDGLHAYQLAVTVDDAAQAITHVVRGADLLTSTPRQMLLQRALQFRSPAYAHMPLAIDRFGRKLSKSSHAPPVDIHPAARVGTLWFVLAFLRQDPPAELKAGSLSELLDWSIAHWTMEPLRYMKSQRLTDEENATNCRQ